MNIEELVGLRVGDKVRRVGPQFTVVEKRASHNATIERVFSVRDPYIWIFNDSALNKITDLKAGDRIEDATFGNVAILTEVDGGSVLARETREINSSNIETWQIVK